MSFGGHFDPPPPVPTDQSARRGGHPVILGALEQRRVAGAAHLQRRLAGEVGGAAAAGPRLRVQELTRMVGAVAEARPVEAGVVGLVQLLRRVALHEQVDRHDTRTLWGEGGEGGGVTGDGMTNCPLYYKYGFQTEALLVTLASHVCEVCIVRPVLLQIVRLHIR